MLKIQNLQCLTTKVYKERNNLRGPQHNRVSCLLPGLSYKVGECENLGTGPKSSFGIKHFNASKGEL